MKYLVLVLAFLVVFPTQGLAVDSRLNEENKKAAITIVEGKTKDALLSWCHFLGVYLRAVTVNFHKKFSDKGVNTDEVKDLAKVTEIMLKQCGAFLK